MKSRSAWITCTLALTALAATFVSPAFASCSDRPGTPTNITLTPQEGAINITWRDTTKPGEGSCHDIEIKRTQNGDTSKSVIGGVCLTGGTTGSYLLSNIGYNQAYCVRMKARDHAGTQGCVSANWSATVCASSLNPPFGGGGGGGPTPTREIEPGTDRPGNDYNNFNLTAADPALCQTACKGDNRCIAWTYVRPNSIQGPNPRCWLKNAVPPPHANNCCTSGVPDKFIPPK